MGPNRVKNILLFVLAACLAVTVFVGWQQSIKISLLEAQKADMQEKVKEAGNDLLLMQMCTDNVGNDIYARIDIGASKTDLESVFHQWQMCHDTNVTLRSRLLDAPNHP